MRLLLIDFLFSKIYVCAGTMESTPSTGDFIRDPNAGADYWETSSYIHKLERLIVALKDENVAEITLPFPRQEVISDLMEEVQWLLSDDSMIAGTLVTPAERRRFAALAKDGMGLLEALVV
jgi:hypothetical protein